MQLIGVRRIFLLTFVLRIVIFAANIIISRDEWLRSQAMVDIRSSVFPRMVCTWSLKGILKNPSRIKRHFTQRTDNAVNFAMIRLVIVIVVVVGRFTVIFFCVVHACFFKAAGTFREGDGEGVEVGVAMGRAA
jgi:hypothetical protein